MGPTVAAKIMAAFFLSLAVMMLASSSSSYSSIFVTDAFTTPTPTTWAALLTVTKRRQGIGVNPALTVLDVTARNGLSYEDVEIGTGRNIFPGDTIVCYYIGLYHKTSSSSSTVNRQSDEDDSTTNPFSAAAFSSFKNRNQGKKIIFDETEPGDPAKVLIGKRTVIRGWDLGICGNRDLDIPPMKIGGERVLRIPAPLAYGQEGSDVFGIPPSTPLEFQISILDAQKDLENGVTTATIQKGILGLGIALLLILGIVATFSQNMTMVYRFLKVDG